MHSQTRTKALHLNIRIKAQQRTLIEPAAAAADTTVSDFVCDAALRDAQNALLDRSTIYLNEEKWGRFTAALDAPPKANPRLCDLMLRQPAWEK